MAEYIRFHWTRAKAGVTMAFLALLGGLVERTASADAAHGKAHSGAAVDFFKPVLSLNGITGNLRTDLKKLDNALGALYYKEQKAIGIAIKKADSLFYSKHVADATFLSQTDAGKLYMKVGSTAANSSELGGLAPSAYFHGNGGVVSGALTLGGAATTPQTLIPSTGNGGLIIVVTPQPAAGNVHLSVTNSTTAVLIGLLVVNGKSQQVSLAPGATDLTPNGLSGNDQVTLQTFPASGFDRVLTLTVSTVALQGGGFSVAGQLVNGVNGDG